MKYTNKPTKQVLAELKSRMRNKKRHLTAESKVQTMGDSKEEEPGIRRKNTVSSLSNVNEDVLLSDTDKISRYDRESHENDKETENAVEHHKG
jgi:predicted transposase YbfD/YdcC